MAKICKEEINNSFAVIYKITNLLNGEKYIGYTTRKGQLLNRHFGSGIYIRRAIKKYGKENFQKEILCTCKNSEQTDRLEKLYIKIFNPSYNISKGGVGPSGIAPWNKGLHGTYSEQTIEKIRLANIGKKYSNEVNAKKASHKKNNGMYGRNDQCYKQNGIVELAKNNKGKTNIQIYGEEKANIIKKRQSEKMSNGGNPRSIAINCTNIFNNEKKFFQCKKEAALYTQINVATIDKIAINKRGPYKGYTFSYAKEEIL